MVWWVQHRSFVIDSRGATIGRKQSNLVSLSQEKGEHHHHHHTTGSALAAALSISTCSSRRCLPACLTAVCGPPGLIISSGSGDEVLGLDSAVSGEHCRIEWSSDGCFVLLDGVRGKASTNGTWVRLSYMQQASLREFLKKDDEILIGGILR